MNQSNFFSCQVLATHKINQSRITQVTTPHGSFITPAFMPVGTRAGVNNLTPKELKQTKSQIILGGNTYHMLCAPALDIIEKAGGMHVFMGWDGPMLTDSGGFQVFSLSKNKELCTIDDQGASFKLPGKAGGFYMTPESSIATQKIIGADIIMAFDQCTPNCCTKNEAKDIMVKTHRWLKQSLIFHQQNPYSKYGFFQALFGIVQGGLFSDLRQESADFVSSLDVDGIALGGESIGFDMKATVEIIRTVHSYLLEEKPRYAMGVGLSPQDLIEVVAEGIDMFDCVAPTRNARHGALYQGRIIKKDSWLKFESPYENQRIQIKKAEFAQDHSPIMEDCDCYTCLHHSRAYLHQLFKQKAPSFTALASIHNIRVMQKICEAMRDCIFVE